METNNNRMIFGSSASFQLTPSVLKNRSIILGTTNIYIHVLNQLNTLKSPDILIRLGLSKTVSYQIDPNQNGGVNPNGTNTFEIFKNNFIRPSGYESSPTNEQRLDFERNHRHLVKVNRSVDGEVNSYFYLFNVINSTDPRGGAE